MSVRSEIEKHRLLLNFARTLLASTKQGVTLAELRDELASCSSVVADLIARYGDSILVNDNGSLPKDSTALHGDIRDPKELDALVAWFEKHWTPAMGVIHETGALDQFAFAVIEGKLYVGAAAYEELRAGMEHEGIDPKARESNRHHRN